jgi:hypothetical protein
MNKYLFLYLLLSSSSYAATIHFSEEIVPLEINNKKIEKSFFSRVTNIEVKPGSHKIKLQYEDLFEVDFDDHQTIESEPFWVVIDIENSEGEYLLSIPRPDDIESASLFIKNPYAELSRLGSQNKSRLEPVTTALMVVETSKSTVKSLKQPVANNVPDTSSEVGNTPKISPNSTSVGTPPDALSMLDFWWSQASEKERKAFLKDKQGN